MKKSSSASFIDIDSCIYLGSRATTNKFIARVKLPDGTTVHAWSDTKPSMPIGTECSVEHTEGTETYNLYS